MGRSPLETLRIAATKSPVEGRTPSHKGRPRKARFLRTIIWENLTTRCTLAGEDGRGRTRHTRPSHISKTRSLSGGTSMSTSTLRPPAATQDLAANARGLLRFVYTHNPFYVISAWFVFGGLRVSFDPQGKLF